MLFIRSLLLVALLGGGLAAADLVCESKNSMSATYNWNNSAAWTCYSQGKAVVADEYPGKNFPANQYIVVLGLTTNSSIVTEHAMNVDSTLGVLGKSYVQYAIAAIANNGSNLIRVTTATNTVATGDKVFCFAASGAGANSIYGIWTATAIDTTHFDLQGSTFSSSTITSGYCEFPAAVKRQGYASAATTVGKWKVNAGVTARFRGDVIDSWAYATRPGSAPNWDTSFWMVRCGDATNGGCNWVWDGGGPVAYKTARGGAAPGMHLSLYVHGTPAQHATVTCLTGASACAAANQGSFPLRNYGVVGGADIDYADFSNLGGTNEWMGIYADAGTVFKMSHFTVSNSGYLRFSAAADLPMPSGSAYFTMSYGIFKDTACNGIAGCIAGLTIANPQTIGPAVVFDSGNAGKNTLTTSGGAITFDRTYQSGSTNLYTPAGSGMKDSIFAKQWDDQGTAVFGLESLTNSFIWQQHDATTPNNPHTLSIPYASSGVIRVSQMTIDGNVFQGDGGYADSQGQMLDQYAYTSAATPPVIITIKNNIMIPDYEFDGGNATAWHSSNSITFASSSAAASVAVFKIYNNTLFPTTESAAPTLDHAGYYIQTGVIPEFRCNATVMSPAAGAHQLIWTENPASASSQVDAVTPSGIHHNAGFGDIRLTTNVSATNTVGTYYSTKLSAPPAGATNGTDQYFPGRVPKVVDLTRRLRTWANQKYGQTFASDTAVLAYLRADVGGEGPTRLLDIPDLVSWMKAGWTLNEPSLYKACGDGTHIGAAVAATPINPAISGTIVAQTDHPRPAGSANALD